MQRYQTHLCFGSVLLSAIVCLGAHAQDPASSREHDQPGPRDTSRAAAGELDNPVIPGGRGGGRPEGRGGRGGGRPEGRGGRGGGRPEGRGGR